MYILLVNKQQSTSSTIKGEIATVKASERLKTLSSSPFAMYGKILAWNLRKHVGMCKNHIISAEPKWKIWFEFECLVVSKIWQKAITVYVVPHGQSRTMPKGVLSFLWQLDQNIWNSWFRKGPQPPPKQNNTPHKPPVSVPV